MGRADLIFAIRAAERELMDVAGRRDLAIMRAMHEYRAAIEAAEQDRILHVIQSILAGK